MNTGALYKSLLSLLLGMYPEVELLNYMVILGLIFLRNRSPNLSHPFQCLLCFGIFVVVKKNSHTNGCEVMSHSGVCFVFCIIGVGGRFQFALMDFSCCHRVYFIFAVSLSLDFPTSHPAFLLTSCLQTLVPSDPLPCIMELKL